MIRFFVPGIPKTAGSKRSFIHPHTKRIVTVEDCKKSADWRGDVKKFALEAMRDRELLDEALSVVFVFMLPRPSSHLGAKGIRPSAPLYPDRKPDVLKLARAAEDAMTSIVWTDDSRIVDEHLFKRYSDSGKAGCFIAVSPVYSFDRYTDMESIINGASISEDPEYIVREMGLRWF